MKSSSSQKKTIMASRWWLRLAAIFFIIFLVWVGAAWSYQEIYAGKIFPGVRVGSLDLGGQTREEVHKILEKRTDLLTREGFLFVWQDKEISVGPIVVSPVDPDFSYKILSFNLAEMVESAYEVGRDRGSLLNFWEELKSLFSSQQVAPIYELNEEELVAILVDNFSSYESPARDAQLIFTDDHFEIKAEELGRVFDYHEAVGEIKKNLSQLELASAAMFFVTDYPEVIRDQILEVLPEAEQIVALAPLVFNFEAASWQLEAQELARWLEPQGPTSSDLDTRVTIGLKDDAVQEYFKNLAAQIDIEPQNAKFEITNGKVSAFQNSQSGRRLALRQNLSRLEEKLLREKVAFLDLIVEEVEPAVTMDHINNLGLKELVGEGRSNFAGSPPNRRHNIKVGAEILDGILVKPDQVFSLGEALGEINAESGYRPELVIKGSKTIPEYGGGLCQIATTAFRAALGAGLPIIERHPHSYRVSYYEPAGKDAAIYTPYVDVKFKNDTGAYLLLQTAIEGDELIFKFYGTRDGRLAKQSGSRISNFVKPPPTKIVETEDLPPGEKKCTERAHTGADAEFDYEVTYPDGRRDQKTFYSHYQPWQEVCLVGVEPPEEDSAAVSVEENLEEKNSQ